MDDLREVIARGIHVHLSRRDVMQYLDNEEDCDGLADATLAAVKQAGFVVVPAEPTAEMEDAGIAAVHIEDGFTPEQAANFAKADHHLDCISGARLEVRACYRAMIEASNAPT